MWPCAIVALWPCAYATNCRSSLSGYAACAIASSLEIMPLKYNSAIEESKLDMPIARTIQDVVSGKLKAADAYQGLLRAVPARHEADPG